MKEEVYKVQKYSVGHRVDKQLLISLQDVFDEYNRENTISVSADCANSSQYIFDSINECFDYFEKKPYRIVKLMVSVIWGHTLYGNKIDIVFDNSRFASTEVKFRFDNGDEYLLIKNKIETCLNNYKLDYRLLSKIPLIATISTIGLVTICLYTKYKQIVFPTIIQYLIIVIWILAFAVSPFCGVKIKRNLFPCTEFWIGQNIMIEEKYTKFRNFLLITIGVGMMVGIVVNCISGFLFK